MSMAFPGMTHCSNCWRPLDMGEFGLCSKCAGEEKRKQEKHELEVAEKKLRNTIREETKDIMKEFTSVMAESKRIDEEYEEKTVNVSISTNKPEDMTYSDWYADIGYEIIKAYLSGNKQVKIRFEEEK